jgi:large subunit ribosomal protein L27e
MGIVTSGKVVLVLSGRFAGKKAVVVRTFDEGTSDKKFGHALVAGIDRNPRKVTKAMSKTKVAKRSKVKPFLKYVNYTHLMPTRYTVDMDLKKMIDDSDLKSEDVKKEIKKVFEERYLNQKDQKSEKKATGNAYFFNKLRF